MNTANDTVLRLGEAATILGLSKASISRLLRDGELRKIQLTKRAVATTRNSINEFISRGGMLASANVE
jgi:predicted DNA-binding transcriptional regulator AlpA